MAAKAKMKTETGLCVANWTIFTRIQCSGPRLLELEIGAAAGWRTLTRVGIAPLGRITVPAGVSTGCSDTQSSSRRWQIIDANIGRWLGPLLGITRLGAHRRV